MTYGHGFTGWCGDVGSKGGMRQGRRRSSESFACCSANFETYCNCCRCGAFHTTCCWPMAMYIACCWYCEYRLLINIGIHIILHSTNTQGYWCRNQWHCDKAINDQIGITDGDNLSSVRISQFGVNLLLLLAITLGHPVKGPDVN